MKAKEWFHGVLGAKESESRLTTENRPGLFLVRQNPFNDHYIVSFIDQKLRIRHYKIPGTTGDNRDKGLGKKLDFSSVTEAVNFMVNRIWVEGLSPVKPPSEIPGNDYCLVLKKDQCYICEETSMKTSMKTHLICHRMYYCETCDRLVTATLLATLKLCLAAGESQASSTMTENVLQLMEKLLVAAAACHGRSLEQY